MGSVREQAYLVERSEQVGGRLMTASTKTRSEVSGGGAKPYRQKGTGNARRGTSRTPLRRGGGVVFGPSPRVFRFKLNRKFRAGAVRNILNDCGRDVVRYDYSDLDFAKTKVANDFFAGVLGERAGQIVVVFQRSSVIPLGIRNLSYVTAVTVDSLRIDQVLSSALVIVEKGVDL